MAYDLAVIGAGWAGLNAALRAKELGRRVALIERDELGGTCLNKGCIPTKALIQSAKTFSLVRKSRALGVELPPGEASVRFEAVQEHKEKIVLQLRQGISFMLKGIDLFQAEATINSPTQIQAGERRIEAAHILIASGSKPLTPQTLGLQAENILSSDQILELQKIPSSLLVIGGGVIGCEFACLFAAFGVRVSIVELAPQLLPGVEREVAKKLETVFKKKGISVVTGTDARAFPLGDYEKVLFCIGRVACTEGLGLERLGVAMHKSALAVDEYLKTNLPNVYAAGDCNAKAMLAHAARYQARRAVENMFLDGPPRPLEAHIPNCIFTDPEIATIGLSEEQAKAQGFDATAHKAEFMGSGMARIMEEADGFVKVVADARRGNILGAHIIGPRATELIGIFALALAKKATLKDIGELVFPHPTVSETIIEACLKGYGI